MGGGKKRNLKRKSIKSKTVTRKCVLESTSAPRKPRKFYEASLELSRTCISSRLLDVFFRLAWNSPPSET